MTRAEAAHFSSLTAYFSPGRFSGQRVLRQIVSIARKPKSPDACLPGVFISPIL
jgi:hypothetical protein